MNLIEYQDEDGTVLHGYPVVIIANRSSTSVAHGSKTRFVDSDNRIIDATPLIICEDYRETGDGGGSDLVVLQFGRDDLGTAVTAGPRRDYVRPTSDMTIVACLASVYTPSYGGTPVAFDVNVHGLSVFGAQKLLIDNGEKSSATAVESPTIANADVYANSEITIDIDSAGAGATSWRLAIVGIRKTLPVAPPAPLNSAAPPALVGNPAVGSTLTVSSFGSWLNNPDGYEVEWLRDGAVVDWTSGVNYTVKVEDAGKTISARIRAANGGGSDSRDTPGVVITMPKPQNITVPSIGTSGIESLQINADVGTWRYSPTSYLYLWQSRPTPTDPWSTITGASTVRFTPPPALVGFELRIGVAGVNGSGVAEVYAFSAPILISASRFSASWPPPPKDPAEWLDPWVKRLPTGSGRQIDVGPGEAHTELDTVPWMSLGPGDVVNIAYRDAPYNTKIGLTCLGTMSDKVVIRGCTDILGRRPIIEGAGARTALDQQSPDGTAEIFFSAEYTEFLGVVFISHHWRMGVLQKPQHIIIENLQIQGGWSQTNFIDQFGDVTYYIAHTAGIYASVVEYLEVENCILTNNSHGFFCNSNNDVDERTSYFVTLRRNQIYGNGEPGEPYEHNIYMQCIRPLIEGNYIGQLRPSAGGSSCKDRSSGTVIRYNTFDVAARACDMVDSEDGGAVVRRDPLYPYAWIYGNYFNNDWKKDKTRTSSTSMIHWSGDNSASTFRNGNLYFYNNTVRVNADTDDFYHISIFSGANLQSKFVVTNNVFAKYGTTYLSWADSGNVIDMYGTNVVTTGTAPAFGALATINQYGTLIEVDDPLVNPDGSLQAGSPGIGAGLAVITSPPPPAYAPNLQVLWRPVHPASYAERVQLGSASDAGCYETATGTPAPPPPPPPTILDPIAPSRTLDFNLADGLTLATVNYKFLGSPTHYVTAGNGLRIADAYVWTAQRVRWVDGQGADQSASMVRRGQSWGSQAGELGLTLRDDGENYYSAAVNKTGWQLRRNGSYVDSDSVSVDWTADVTLTLTVVGGTLTLRCNGTVLNTRGYTDSAPLTGGYPGFYIQPYGLVTAHIIESFTDSP